MFFVFVFDFTQSTQSKHLQKSPTSVTSHTVDIFYKNQHQMFVYFDTLTHLQN